MIVGVGDRRHETEGGRRCGGGRAAGVLLGLSARTHGACAHTRTRRIEGGGCGRHKRGGGRRRSLMRTAAEGVGGGQWEGEVRGIVVGPWAHTLVEGESPSSRRRGALRALIGIVKGSYQCAKLTP